MTTTPSCSKYIIVSDKKNKNIKKQEKINNQSYLLFIFLSLSKLYKYYYVNYIEFGFFVMRHILQIKGNFDLNLINNTKLDEYIKTSKDNSLIMYYLDVKQISKTFVNIERIIVNSEAYKVLNKITDL